MQNPDVEHRTSTTSQYCMKKKQTNKQTSTLTVRVKGGMSLRNGVWHGLRNDITIWNVIYAE